MEINLKDVLESAGGTASLVIACTIFLHQLITVYTANFERYRALAREHREMNGEHARRDSLRDQITLYYRRCQAIRRSMCIVAGAEVAFIITIIASGLSAAMPETKWIGLVGGGSLVIGLLVLGVAAVLEIHQNYLSKYAIESEIADFPELPQQPDKGNAKHPSSVTGAAPGRS
ncbi:MAG TPA: DUF2721 domain-containing protein [Abditibacteriaceae bacterium]